MTAENPILNGDIRGHKVFHIYIDRAEYQWRKEKITGAQLRRLPATPIPSERDLFQAVPGHPGRRIKDDDSIRVEDGLHFYTAPKDNPEPKVFTIRIDRAEYQWRKEKITGAQLRHLPAPPIPPERDLFQVVPGHPDRKIEDHDSVTGSRRATLLHCPQHDQPWCHRGDPRYRVASTNDAATVRYCVSARTGRFRTRS